MLHMTTEMTNIREGLTADFKDLESELKEELAAVRGGLETLEQRVKRVHARQSGNTVQVATVLSSLTGVLQLVAAGVFETRLRLSDDDDSMQNDAEDSASNGAITDDTFSRQNASGQNSGLITNRVTSEQSVHPSGTHQYPPPLVLLNYLMHDIFLQTRGHRLR